MDDYSKIINDCALTLFPSIESIALPTEIPIDIAKKTHLTQTMPEVLLYPVSLEDKIQIEKDTNTGYTENPSWILESQNSILKHSACLPLYELMQNARLEDQGKVFLVEGLCFRREKKENPLTFHLREFHMKEIVFIGLSQFCQESQIKAESIWNKIRQRTGLSWISSSASDSFYPSYNEALSGIQTITSSKKEFNLPMFRGTRYLTCGSSNIHRITFSKPFNIRMQDGSLACSSCLAFGLERLCFADFSNSLMR